MMTVAQAESTILSLVQPVDAPDNWQTLPLNQAHQRILATPTISQLDFPHWDNSAMDGYAVRHADVQSATAEAAVSLAIVEEIPAGHQPQQTLGRGQAARIFTGSVLPTGADTIVMQELTNRVTTAQGDRVLIYAAPKPGAFVRQRATFYQAGQELLPQGLRLNPAAIAVLAAAQCSQVTVYRQPRVAILSTGDELVKIDQPLQVGQIVDSNQYALAAAVVQAGCVPLSLGVVADRPERLKTAIAQALGQADVVISSGGVSVGDYDYVAQILQQLGGTIHIQSVAVKPGKPLTVATFDASGEPGEHSPERSSARAASPQLYFGLPGNPVSALVTFWRFVQPALAKLSGQSSDWGPQLSGAIAAEALKSDGQRESYLWGRVAWLNGQLTFHLAGGSHSSGNLINLAGTNALAILPVGVQAIAPGELIQVMLLN